MLCLLAVHGRPPRIAGFDYRGIYRYSLTFCTRGRHRAFSLTDAVTLSLFQIRRTAIETSFEIPAYCFMPDHLHLLVEGTCLAADLQRFARLAKQRSGAAYALQLGRPLWQEGYFDRVLRTDDELEPLVKYLLENPVRAGIVRHPAEYPHLGSDRYTLDDLFDAMI
jgi:putative transposase